MAKNTIKDSAMAKRMREEGVTRDTGRCELCLAYVALSRMYQHVAYHKVRS